MFTSGKRGRQDKDEQADLRKIASSIVSLLKATMPAGRLP